MSDRHPLQPIFKVSTHKDLIAALVARRRSLGLTQIDVDAIGGLAGGHTAKIECGTKKVGYVSLALLLPPAEPRSPCKRLRQKAQSIQIITLQTRRHE